MSFDEQATNCCLGFFYSWFSNSNKEKTKDLKKVKQGLLGQNFTREISDYMILFWQNWGLKMKTNTKNFWE